MRRKRGQLDLSFGLIFSVILIVAFLGFAVYAIVNFLGMKDKIEVGKFIADFQEDVNVLWRSMQGMDDFSYSLPLKIKEVCFIDSTKGKKGRNASIYEELNMRLAKDANLIFYPLGSSKGLFSVNIEHIDLSNMTKMNNPLCFPNKNGKTTLVLEQESGGTNLVIVR